MEPIALQLTYIIFGLLIGSFLTVCVYRLPERLSVYKPVRSFCPECKKPILWQHNIPVFSWLFLKGTCAYCPAKIPLRYPLIELTTAFAALLTFDHFGTTPTGFAAFTFVCFLIVAAYIDIFHLIIPNRLNLYGFILGLILAAINQFYPIFDFPMVPDLKESILGSIFGAAPLFIMSVSYLFLTKKEGLGMGDVKLLAFVGTFIGREGAIFTIFVGSIIGTLWGVLAAIIRRGGLKQHFPFGPSLVLASILYVFAKDQILDSWQNFILYMINR